MLVTKNKKANIAVVRVKVLAAPRGEKRPPKPAPEPPPPPPPIPSAPPSERCRRTTPIKAIAIKRWITIRTDCMSFHCFWARFCLNPPTAPSATLASIDERQVGEKPLVTPGIDIRSKGHVFKVGAQEKPLLKLHPNA
jgi:hypothetical protein